MYCESRNSDVVINDNRELGIGHWALGIGNSYYIYIFFT